MIYYYFILVITYIFIVIMTLGGWKFNISKLDLKKNLIVIGTETCLADSIILARATLLLKGKLDRVFGISKKEAWYLKPFSKNIIFVDRDKRLNQVDKIVNKITQVSEPFMLFIFPEGTTKKVDKWRTGFHYIAQKTNADICIIGIDHKNHVVNLDKIFTPSEKYEKNIKFMKKRLRKYPLAVPKYSNLD